jgi:porphobilinogen synthase
MIKRARRLRQNSSVRNLVSETKLHADDFVYPIFIKENIQKRESIKSLIGQDYLSQNELQHEVEKLLELGINAIALFPVISPDYKTIDAKEAYNINNFLNKTVELTQRIHGDSISIITDVALDPYTTHGHDGLIEDGKILNDKTVEILCKMALSQAQAGADIVAPSDMMDGRVAAIRETLDRNGFEDVMIMSYTAKYASSLYGPFRDALGSLGSKESSIITSSKGAKQSLSKDITSSATLPRNDNKVIPSDKKTYQMNPSNKKEALKELEMDIGEGADIVMVKPASWYLDIIHQFKENSTVPVAAYQVSGEYAMMQAAFQAGYLDKEIAIEESLIAIKRAGADIILSYFAKEYLEKRSN